MCSLTDIFLKKTEHVLKVKRETMESRWWGGGEISPIKTSASFV